MTEVSENPQMLRYKTPELTSVVYTPIYYKDVNANYTLNDKGINVIDSDAIRQKLMNILSVIPGEEHFEPLWGSRIPYRLFEPINGRTAFLMEFDTVTAAHSFMSADIEVLHNQCSVTPMDDEDGYVIDLVYTEKRNRIVDRFRFRLITPR